MSFEIGDTVQFERGRSPFGDRDGEVIIGTVTTVQGWQPYLVYGVRGPGVSENYLIPERHLRRYIRRTAPLT